MNFQRSIKKARFSRRENVHNSHVPSDENDQVISFINSQNLGWTADKCKLQKHHKDYNKDECEEESLLQTGVEEDKTKIVKEKIFGESTDEFKRAFNKL